MFAIIDATTGAVVDHARTWHQADAIAQWFTTTTLRLHIVRAVAR